MVLIAKEDPSASPGFDERNRLGRDESKEVGLARTDVAPPLMRRSTRCQRGAIRLLDVFSDSGPRMYRVGPKQRLFDRARVMRQRFGKFVGQDAREWREKPHDCGLNREDSVAT